MRTELNGEQTSEEIDQEGGARRWLRLALGCGLAIAIAVFGLDPPAAANSWPPMAVGMFSLPLFASIVSFGLGLVAIVVLEARILAQRTGLGHGRSLWLMAVANFWSFLAGLGFTLGATVLPFLGYGSNSLELRFIIALWFGSIAAAGLGTATTRQVWRGRAIGSWRRWAERGFALLVWLLGWMAIFVAIAVINDRSLSPILHTLIAILYFGLGWVLSWTIEAAWIVSRCRAEVSAGAGRSLIKTVAIANLRSYAYIAVPITIGLFLLRKH